MRLASPRPLAVIGVLAAVLIAVVASAVLLTSPPQAESRVAARQTPETPPTAEASNGPEKNPLPAGRAFPDERTTGVPAGTELEPSGPLTVTEDGAVIEDLEVEGSIDIQANDVTIRRVKVVGGTIAAGYGEYTGTVVEDVEIDGRRADGTQAVDAFTAGIGGSNFTCRRCHIHHVGHGINMGSNVVIEDSYVHDVVYSPENGGSHNDSILSNGGSSNVIRGNTLTIESTPGSSAALALYGDFAPIQDVLVEDNLIDGGGYCTYAGSVDGKNHPQATGVRYINNRFGRTFHPDCGEHGPVSAFDPAGPGNVWTGNVWFDTGSPVSPTGG